MSKQFHLHIYGGWHGLTKATQTCVFKSSFCKSNVFIFDDLDEGMKVKDNLMKIGIRSSMKIRNT